MVTNTAAKLAATAGLCISVASAIVAQTSPLPGPAAPPKSLPVPKGGENLVLNPTIDECRAGWRPGVKWTKEQFAQFCRQMEISK
jgi:hypothetical protein